MYVRVSFLALAVIRLVKGIIDFVTSLFLALIFQSRYALLSMFEINHHINPT